MLLVSNAPEASTWLPSARVVTDVRAERGSLVGLHSALVHARDTVLVVAWDMPFVTRELVSLIAFRAARSEYATVPMSESGAEPLCAAYTQACLPAIEAGLDEKDFRLSSLLARLPSVDYLSADELRTAGDSQRLFFNVNGSADLQAANLLD
jgi:molybdopterin-guanine dinucleotide biosynthesis protein A